MSTRGNDTQGPGGQLGTDPGQPAGKRKGNGAAEVTLAPAVRALNVRYAAAQSNATRVALFLVVLSYGLYVSGALSALVPVETLPAMLGEGLDAFLQDSGLPTGWAWVTQIAHGDLLTLAALLCLVAAVGVAYVALLPLLIRQRNWVLAGIVTVQLLVFALAATGWVSGGH